MKKIVLPIVALFILALGCGVAFAGKPGNGALSGKHYTMNIIGHPQDYKGNGDTSSGSSIFIPLHTETGPAELICEADPSGQTVLKDDIAPTYTTSEPLASTRIYFTAGDHFEITDRDATDGRADVIIPVDLNSTSRYITVDVYMRVLGKPNTCMDIDAYAYDADQLGGLWFLAGHVDINRTTGKSSFVKVNDLFDVWFCNVDPTTQLCADAPVELSVFNDVFDGYFWNIFNDGTRLVQVRLYPR